MPIRLSPKNTVKVYLASDISAYPEADRPAFVCHYPSAHERIAVVEKFREFDAEQNSRKRIALLVEAARMVVDRWENADELTWENMGDVLTFEELDELTTKMMTETRLTEDDKKKSVSPPPSASGESATPAATDA